MNNIANQAVQVIREPRLQVFERLANTIPQNDFGLPIFLYRADLVPPNLENLDEKERNGHLQAASITISYREGFPTFQYGIPLWGQMDHEPSADFNLFQQYLELGNSKGYRQLADLERQPDVEGLISLRGLQELYTYNFWAPRAKAHDLFIAASHRKLREARIMSAENMHYMEAENLLSRLRKQFDVIFSEEALQAIPPDKAVNMLSKLHLLQQRALGIDGSQGKGQNNGEGPPAHATMEVTLRQMAKDSGATIQAEQGQKNNSLDLLLNDPQAAGMAQELIVRMSVKGGQFQPPKAGAPAIEADAAADLKLIGQ